MPAKRQAHGPKRPPTGDAGTVVADLQKLADKRVRDDMEPRYGIVTGKAFGVPMAAMLRMAKELGCNHQLAGLLWETGWYEARTIAALIADPRLLTPSQMDGWCRDFDNWAICDTVCFKLFDRSPHAWEMIRRWSDAPQEFVRRAAFALLASVALHDKKESDGPFIASLELIERASGDERNFVKKSVSWALRSIGRRNAVLHAAVVEMCHRLTASDNTTARWIARDALKDITGAAAQRQLSRKPAGT